MRLRNIALMSALLAPTAALADSADPTGADPTAGDPTIGEPAAGDAAAPANPVSVFPLQPGDGVSLGQVVFETDADGAYSAWGRVEVDPVRVSRTLGEPFGFINVRVRGEWVALNVPVDTDPRGSFSRAIADAEIVDDGGALPVVTYFDLGSTRARWATPATVVFSTEPLLQVADFENLATLPSSKYRLAKVNHTLPFGTDLDAPGPGGLPPAPLNPTLELPDPLQGYWNRSTPNPVNIESARNQCVPIAAANALSYMRQTFGASRGFSAPHTATRGVRNGGGFSIAEEMDERMRRPTTDKCNGSGTGYCPDFGGDSSLYDGVTDYLSLWNDDDRLSIRVQGEKDTFCFNSLAIDTVSDGAVVTFDWICDRIEDGDGITLTYDRFNNVDEQGNPAYSGAHAIRVHGCGEMGGRPFIRVLNDTQQDGNVANVCTERAGLESQLVYLEDLNGDGRLNYGGNMLREVVQVMAIHIDP